MIEIPRLSETTLEGQVRELKLALFKIVKQTNLEISMLNKKIEEAKKNGNR